MKNFFSIGMATLMFTSFSAKAFAATADAPTTPPPATGANGAASATHDGSVSPLSRGAIAAGIAVVAAVAAIALIESDHSH